MARPTVECQDCGAQVPIPDKEKHFTIVCLNCGEIISGHSSENKKIRKQLCRKCKAELEEEGKGKLRKLSLKGHCHKPYF